mgnify:CR=1 FL=1
MKKNRFGIPEPELRCQDIRLLEEHQVILMPLVGFDSKGNRLGMGGGFYDRTLEGLRAKKPTLAIGFAYAAQEQNDLPLEPTDQPLDLIVTEQGIIEPS